MIFYFITFGFVCDSITLLSKFVTNIAFTDYSAFLFQKSVTSHHFYGLSHGFLLKIRNIPAMLYNAIESHNNCLVTCNVICYNVCQ